MGVDLLGLGAGENVQIGLSDSQLDILWHPRVSIATIPLLGCRICLPACQPEIHINMWHAYPASAC